MNFGIFLENYHKIAGTAITHSSHHVKAIDCKTCKLLIEKLLKQNINQKKLLSLEIYHIIYFLFRLTTGMISLETVFADISITFFTEV